MKHLKLSSQNPQFTLIRSLFSFTSVVPISVHHLLENPSNLIILTNDPYYWLKYNRSIFGSCNGLLCLLGDSSRKANNNQNYRIIWFRFWNASIRTISEKLGSFDDFSNLLPSSFHFAFGYDNSNDTYKVVALRDSDGEAKVKRITLTHSKFVVLNPKKACYHDWKHRDRTWYSFLEFWFANRSTAFFGSCTPPLPKLSLVLTAVVKLYYFLCRGSQEGSMCARVARYSEEC
ncbi:hypothetical protein MTR_7g056727 [Medicago truncatula]|uniref:Uncharacterized protein n=1 Tax=Medicago truncatula TaxID=3880 RepID=A0A072UAA1_MEDTR|nr:hypothetical protein MTR_7g056727 [Medicago truncatula]